MKIRKDITDSLAELYRKYGMPDHCGLCKKFKRCSHLDPSKICLWLKKSKVMLKRFSLAFAVVVVLTAFQGSSAMAQSGTAVIGSEGGEVVSSDNKVKLVIPSGALAGNTSITISTITPETLDPEIPQGTILLNLVECLPHGLIFQSPIEIVYTLSSPEIPGTPVMLGLYDGGSEEVVSTGVVSKVEADGVTVKAQIEHFSIYAALKNLIPQGAPIGGGVKIPLPDMLTGAFSHGIPIAVSPGRKKIQPSLGLTYRSGGGNSWTGYGFSLNPGYIVRSTRLGPPSYNDEQDTFYLITDAGTTELVHLIDNLYQSKIESAFSKFYKESDDSWRVVGKDGSVMKFGESPDAREISSNGTFSWAVTKAQDTNGNYIEFVYSKDQGKFYLSRINYTGHDGGTAPTNSVEFILEDRSDVSFSYISTSKITTAKRLKEILAKVGNDVVWRYALEYAYSPDSDRSLLMSVTQFASDNSSLPVQTFTYQRSND